MDDEILRQKYHANKLKLVSLKNKLNELNGEFDDLNISVKETLLINDKVVDEEEFLMLDDINNKIIDELGMVVIPMIDKNL
ncbi:MAG: hypothetical protein VZS44_08510 [Bacilli bacterium]|nr:hypothetical protein [Bacilli bacterium]